MNKSLAVNILNLNYDFDQDELEDAYDDAVFTIKRFFLQNVVIESLWLKKNLRLNQIEQAYQTLNGEEHKYLDALVLNKVPSKVEKYLEYEMLFYELKKHLSNCIFCVEVIQVSNAMIQLESQYNQWFLNVIKKQSTGFNNFDLKLNQKVNREILIKLDQVQGNFNQLELQQIAQEKKRIEKLLSIK